MNTTQMKTKAIHAELAMTDKKPSTITSTITSQTHVCVWHRLKGRQKCRTALWWGKKEGFQVCHVWWLLAWGSQYYRYIVSQYYWLPNIIPRIIIPCVIPGDVLARSWASYVIG